MALKVTQSQSADAKTLTFKDESVISDPISNYVRTVQIWDNIDATGSLITTITFSGSSLTVDYAVSTDQYFSAKLIYTGSPSVAASPPINFVTTQYEYNLLDQKLLVNCGCGSKCKGCDNLTMGALYLSGAQKAVLNSNPAKANNYISASYKFLKA